MKIRLKDIIDLDYLISLDEAGVADESYENPDDTDSRAIVPIICWI